ncbi:hypothetical protein PCANB_002056 [Pneumocystis canis]|nr:hypothetical protein PCANB_002056 [Pneumocystis canis]
MDLQDISYDEQEELNNLMNIIVPNAPIESGKLKEWKERRRTLKVVIHPLLNMSISWISGENIHTDIRTKKKQIYEFSQEESVLYTLHTPAFYLNPCQVHLANVLSHYFEELQALYENLKLKFFDPKEIPLTPGQSLIPSFLNRICKSYKIETENAINEYKNDNEVDQDVLMALIDSYTLLHCVEIIYLRVDDKSYSETIIEWVNRSDPQPLQEDGLAIMTSRIPCLHPGFWPYVHKAALRGLFKQVISCLQQSGIESVEPKVTTVIDVIIDILETFPSHKMPFKNENILKWRHWRSKVINSIRTLKLDNPEISSAFRYLFEIISGDKDAIFRESDTWQECLGALILLNDPLNCKTIKDIRRIYDSVINGEDSFTVDETLPVESACAALFSGNIPKAMIQAAHIQTSLAAHIADLLLKSGVLEEFQTDEYPLSLRDYLVLNYADQLIANSDTWRIAPIYWKTVQEIGIQRIKAVLPRIPLTSDEKTEEVLALCDQFSLDEEACMIASIWAKELERKKKLGSAVLLYDRVNNVHQIDQINWFLFETSLVQGYPTDVDDLMESFLTSPYSSSSRNIASLLAPYATLNIFYKLKTEGKRCSAAHYLASLIKAVDIPKKYMLLLLAEMLYFLDDSLPRAFTMRDIFDCTAAIEEFQSLTFKEDYIQLFEKARSAKSYIQKNKTLKVSENWRTTIKKEMNEKNVLELMKIPKETQPSYNEWISQKKPSAYRNLLKPDPHFRENLPTHATPIQIPTKTIYQNAANYHYEKLTFHRYRFSSPYSPYDSFVSPGKAKQTYGKKRRCQNDPFSYTICSHSHRKSDINTQKTHFSTPLLSHHDSPSKVASKDVFHISCSPEKTDSDIIYKKSQKAFNLRTPKHDFNDSDLSSETKTNHLLHTSSPASLPSQPSSPNFSTGVENKSHEEINKVILTIEKSKFSIEDVKTSLFKNNSKKKTNEKDSNIRILNIKNWWTGKFMEDSENMQLMLSKKGFALQKNGELLSQHNYNASEIQTKLNGPGTEYFIQIITTSKLNSLKILQYSCPEVNLIELTPDQAQKMLSLKKSTNLFQKSDFSEHLIKSNEDNTDIVEVPDNSESKSDKAEPQKNTKTPPWLSIKDKRINEKNKPRLIYPPVVLYDDDIERLNDGEFLNDTIIDFYLKYIQNRLFQNNPSKTNESHIFNTFFYKRLVDKDRFGKKGGYQNVKKWTSKTKIDLFTKKYVVVPVNESLHWYVAIICNLDAMPCNSSIQEADKNIRSGSDGKLFSFFSKRDINNSSFDQNNKLDKKEAEHKNVNMIDQRNNLENFFLKNHELSRISENISIKKKLNEERYIEKPHTPFSKNKDLSIRKPIIIIFDSLGGQHNITLKNLRDYLYEEAKDKRDLELNKADIVGIHAKVPQQSNYCDCGVFLLHYVEQFLNDPDKVLPFILDHHNKTSISSDMKDLWGQEKISSLRSELRLLIKHLQNESLIMSKNDTTIPYLNQDDTTDNSYDHDSDELIMYF